jgi:AcrR family transcriptional regulator
MALDYIVVLKGMPSTRSYARIPKLRTRGRASRQKMLAEAERLMAEAGGRPVRFSDIFRAAKVSRGSAYRIYNGIDDLMQDLATAWMNNFVAFTSTANDGRSFSSWEQLSDRIIEVGSVYWHETEETLRILPRVRFNVPESYDQAARDMVHAVADMFERNFFVPNIRNWRAVISMYTQIADVVFSDAIHRDGHISDSRLLEAQILCRTYLSLHLPSSLPARTTGSPD